MKPPVWVAASLVAGIVVVEASPALAAGPRVVINEIHYHAPSDDPDDEFLELHNAGDAPADLSGWCFEGIRYCFPTGSTLAAGAYRVLTEDDYRGGLSNGGELLRLLDATAAVVDEVDYGDRGIWPALADGHGGSLERRDPFGLGTDPGNWMSSTAPTPGARNASAAAGLLPVFSDVVHTVLPAPGAPVDVSAALSRAPAATLYYRIGFGPEVVVPMAVAAGRATASIPGQPAGSLVRYRLEANDGGRIGAWPRQGDGATYVGTTVAKPDASALPRFDWFMEDGAYTRAYKDLKLRGDDGYPCVIAYGGQVFDNAKVRVKGQASRTNRKKKWKFVLPAGHELDAPGVFLGPVNEFGLHSASTDKSFIRETLSSEWMTAAGVVGTQQIFPTRLERNGAFYGLYVYVEQPDGRWRDRLGFDDDDTIVYEAGDRTFGVVMHAKDASLSQRSLRFKYGKETQEHKDDDELRELIRKINGLRGASRRKWIFDNLDVAQMINALAADAVIQHHDFGHKNYRLVLPENGRWQIIPSDFDLSWGRTATLTDGQFGDVVNTRAGYPNAAGLRLANALWYDPVLRAMFDRRTRTLMDTLLGPEPVESRVAELTALTALDATLDRQVWGTYKEPQTAAVAQYEILTSYVPFRRKLLLGNFFNRRTFPPAQPAVPAVAISGVQAVPAANAPEWVELTNLSGAAVDLSGWSIEPLGTVLAPGVVVAAGARIRIVSDLTDDTDPTLGGLWAAAELGAELPDAGATLRLRTAAGDLVHTYGYGAPVAPPGGDTTPPSSVTGLGAASVTGRTLSLSWNAASDAGGIAGYRVYVNGRLAATPTGPSVTLGHLPDGTLAWFEVYAMDTAGNRSTTGAAATVLLPDGTPPGPVRNVRISRGTTSLRLYWTSAADISGIRSYTIELVGGATVSTRGRAAKLTGLAPRTTYEVRIRAVDRLGIVGQPVVLSVSTR